MTTILLLCVVTWLVLAAFVYLIEGSWRPANMVGALGALWVGVILMFIGMTGR